MILDPYFCKRVKESANEEISIGINKIKELVVTGEKIEYAEDSGDTTGKKEPVNEIKNIPSIRVSSEKLDELINMVSELVTTQAGLNLIAEKIDNSELLALAENVEKLARRLRDSTFSIRLIPIDNMINRFQRLVRELSHELNKEIAFIAEGTDIELDKTIIEGLIDPVMHIIRNSIDHGIEAPDLRQKLGKPRQGKITLKACYSGSNVLIRISDDGAGIDANIIRQSAIKKGLIQPDAVLGEKEILDLIFLPGFTTRESITKISGRGVGMDVVKKKISELRGEVNIETRINSGATISIKLPLTLSIIDGLLVEIGNALFIIPLATVIRCCEFNHDTLVKAVNNLILIEDTHVPLIFLRKEFAITSPSPLTEQVVVIENGDTRVGLTIDRIIGEYQAVLKPLGNAFNNQDIISGATILGDGKVALVVDPNRIISQFTYQNLSYK
jgi:two-component system chemotaxis sensor kinase CheA